MTERFGRQRFSPVPSIGWRPVFDIMARTVGFSLSRRPCDLPVVPRTSNLAAALRFASKEVLDALAALFP